MKFKAIRNNMQRVALVSSLACLAFGMATTFFLTSKLSAKLFWLSLVIALAAALVSFPRWESLAALVLVALAYVWSDGGASYVYCSTLPSPDGRYQLAVYSRPMLIVFPGQGSDAPGYVRLQDRSGKALGEGYVGMVHTAYDVEWEADKVRVGPHGDGNLTWELPR
jgi:hypothetical protein